MQNFKGTNIITHHRSWAYLSGWLGLNLIETLEEKPGIPPSSSHLEKVLQTARNNKILAIIRTPYSPDDASEWSVALNQLKDNKDLSNTLGQNAYRDFKQNYTWEIRGKKMLNSLL